MRLICEFASPVEPSELAHLRNEVRALQHVAGDERIVLVIDELFTLALRSGATSATTRIFGGPRETSVSIATDAPVVLAPAVDSVTERLLQDITFAWGWRRTAAGTEWWATIK